MSNPLYRVALVASLLMTTGALAQTVPFTTISVGNSPQVDVASTEDGKVFVLNFASNTVSVIDAATWTKITDVPTGAGPRRARLNNTTNKLYTVNNGGSSVTVINAVTNAFITTIPLPAGSNAWNIGLNEATNRIYVALRSLDQVAVIDGATDSVLSFPATGDDPRAICINPTTNRIYIPNFGSDNVTVLDAVTHNQVAGSPVAVGDGPTGCGIDTVNNRILISNLTADTFSTINGATNTLVGADRPTGDAPTISALSNEDNLLVILNDLSGNATLYTLDTLTLIGTVATGANPWQAVIDSSARTIHVTNRGANTVSVIDLHDGVVKQQIPVGTNPQAIVRHFQNFYVVNNNGGGAGSVSVFPRMNFRHAWDLGDNGRSDIVWRNNASKATSGWLMNGISTTASASLLGPSDWIPVIREDFDGDGNGDIIWRNTATDETAAWFMNDLIAKPGQAGVILGPSAFEPLFAVGCDGTRDRCILWRDPASGQVVYWLMSNGIVPAYQQFIYNSGPGWTPVLIGNFDGDFHSDILWQHTDGTVTAWLMQGDAAAGFSFKANAFLIGPGQGWVPVFTGDFDGDDRTDIVWRNSVSGDTAIWLMNGLVAKPSGTAIIMPGGAGWTVTHVRDLDGDQKSDLLWRHTNGTVAAWLMNGLVPKAGGTGFLLSDPNWQITHTLDTNNDIKSDLLWRSTSGWTSLWLMNGLTPITTTILITDGNWEPLPPD